jgi:ribosome biogenesis GTPase
MEPSLHLKNKSQRLVSKQHYDLCRNVWLIFAKIIDTPGIKGFGVVDMEPAEIWLFSWILNWKSCKFNNCLHKEEPVLWKALEKDEIAWSRYNSYLKLLEGDDENYRTDIHNEDRAISDENRK